MPENTPLDERVVNEVLKDNKPKIFVGLYFWFLGHLIALCVSIAESLGFRETPLESDKKRVRWTCVCSCRLYDDFIELVPGAVEILQRHLDNSDPAFLQSVRITDPSVLYKSIPDPVPKRFEGAMELGINSVRRRQTESIYLELHNRDLDRLVKNRSQSDTPWLLPILCEIERQWVQMPISAFDVHHGKNSPDTELFLLIKKRYSKAKGTFRWFLSPWTVKAMNATFDKHDIKIVPIIGSNYLIYLWQNPHHTDRHTYQKNKSILDKTCWLMRKLLEMARTDTRHAAKILENADDPMKDNHSASPGSTECFSRVVRISCNTEKP